MNKALIIGVGAVNGLGAQLALRFAQRGHHVTIAGRTMSKLEAVADEIYKFDGTCTPLVADSSSEAAMQNLFDTVAEQSGKLSLCIYNVGTNMPGEIADMEASYFEHCWRSCCFGSFLFAKFAVQAMRDAGGTLLFTQGYSKVTNNNLRRWSRIYFAFGTGYSEVDIV